MSSSGGNRSHNGGTGGGRGSSRGSNGTTTTTTTTTRNDNDAQELANAAPPVRSRGNVPVLSPESLQRRLHAVLKVGSDVYDPEVPAPVPFTDELTQNWFVDPVQYDGMYFNRATVQFLRDEARARGNDFVVNPVSGRHVPITVEPEDGGIANLVDRTYRSLLEMHMAGRADREQVEAQVRAERATLEAQVLTERAAREQAEAQVRAERAARQQAEARAARALHQATLLCVLRHLD